MQSVEYILFTHKKVMCKLQDRGRRWKDSIRFPVSVFDRVQRTSPLVFCSFHPHHMHVSNMNHERL